jgi:hypothetical protein
MNTRCLGYVTLAFALSASAIGCSKKASPLEPTPVCTYAISPAALTISSEGGSGTVAVTAGANCSWSATASASWITITAGATGSGPGTITYSVSANDATTSRAGSLTVGGQTHAVTQEPRTATVCSYDLSAGGAEFNKDGGSGTFIVAAPAGCAWTATSNVPWLGISGGAEGSGTAAVSYTVARHTEIAERSGAITVADRRFTIRQSGDVGACQYTVTPVAFSPCMPGGTVTATIATQASCPWTAASTAGWLGVPSGSSGSGSATVSISFSDNYDAPREGVVMLRGPTPAEGQNIHVTQAGCRYAVSRTAMTFIASGGSGTFDVIQQSDPTACGGATQDRCVWTARSDVGWIVITSSMPRAGDNPVAFTVATNDGKTARVGTIVVRDQVVTITQAGR